MESAGQYSAGRRSQPQRKPHLRPALGKPEEAHRPQRNTLPAYGYLEQVRDNATDALYWLPDSAGADDQLKEETLGNGLQVLHTHDPRNGRLTTLSAGFAAQTQYLTYQYDALGNLAAPQSQGEGQVLSERFTYDRLNRLTRASLAGGPSRSFQYGAIR